MSVLSSLHNSQRGQQEQHNQDILTKQAASPAAILTAVQATLGVHIYGGAAQQLQGCASCVSCENCTQACLPARELLLLLLLPQSCILHVSRHRGGCILRYQQ
jgi:hypothetical protein